MMSWQYKKQNSLYDNNEQKEMENFESNNHNESYQGLNTNEDYRTHQNEKDPAEENKERFKSFLITLFIIGPSHCHFHLWDQGQAPRSHNVYQLSFVCLHGLCLIE